MVSSAFQVNKVLHNMILTRPKIKLQLPNYEGYMIIQQKRRKLRHILLGIVFVPILGIISGCTATPAALDMSQTVNEYVKNTVITKV